MTTDGTTGAGEDTMAGTTLGHGTTGAGEDTMAGTTRGHGTTGAGEDTMAMADIMDGDGAHGDIIDMAGPVIMVGEVITVIFTTEIIEEIMHTPTIEQDAVTTIRILMA